MSVCTGLFKTSYCDKKQDKGMELFVNDEITKFLCRQPQGGGARWSRDFSVLMITVNGKNRMGWAANRIRQQKKSSKKRARKAWNISVTNFVRIFFLTSHTCAQKIVKKAWTCFLAILRMLLAVLKTSNTWRQHPVVVVRGHRRQHRSSGPWTTQSCRLQ